MDLPSLHQVDPGLAPLIPDAAYRPQRHAGLRRGEDRIAMQGVLNGAPIVVLLIEEGFEDYSFQRQCAVGPEQTELHAAEIFNADEFPGIVREAAGKLVSGKPLLVLEEVENPVTINEKPGFQVFIDAEGQDLLRGISGQGELGKDFSLGSFEKWQGRVGYQDQDEDDAEYDQHAAQGDDPLGDAVVALGADAELFIH